MVTRVARVVHRVVQSLLIFEMHADFLITVRKIVYLIRVLLLLKEYCCRSRPYFELFINYRELCLLSVFYIFFL